MSEAYRYPISPIPASDERTASDGLPAEDIHNQLDRILGETHFRSSLRLTSFLKFVVETVLAGKPEHIKAYTIAVEALSRDQNFDPQHDPIVRVEAGRLRIALARYYAEPGRDDPLVIELPRGTYVPTFRRRAAGSLESQAPLQPAAAQPTNHSPALAAGRRDCEFLLRVVNRQSSELRAEIAAVRRSLDEYRALLQRPVPGISSLGAPPLVPTPSAAAFDGTLAKYHSRRKRAGDE